jgi:molybdate transport repressor ModE-like protein
MGTEDSPTEKRRPTRNIDYQAFEYRLIRCSMKLDQLRILLAVLEHGSFSRAADDVGVSQSTISFHVAALEATTGARLIDRRRGAVCATPQGTLLQRYARRIVALADEAVRQMQEAEAKPSGHLVIAASTIVAEHLLPSLVRDLRRSCPGVRVTIEVSDSRGALERLRSQRCELALIGAAADARRFDSAPFAYDDIVLVGPPKRRRKLDAATLAEVPLILRELGSGTRSAVADLLVEADLDRSDIVVVGSTEAARRAALAGLGYTFISQRAVRDDLRGRRMGIVAFPGTPMRRWFHIVRERAHTPSPAARALHELVLSSASQ